MKRIKYYFDNLVARGIPSLMGILILATLIFVLIMGTIAYNVALEWDESYPVTLWYTLNHIIDPGYLFGAGGAVEGIPFLFIMTLATFWGILVYSLIISFVSSAFFDKLDALRAGRSQIVESGHTVILDFNESVPIMMQEITEANKEGEKQIVVILADVDPTETLAEIYAVTEKHKNTKIIIRKGLITRLDDLEMVAVGQAKSVIIASKNDITVIRTILALKQTSFFQEKSSHAVCKVSEYNNVQVINEISEGQVEVIYLAQLKSKVFARTCLHPGLSSIYKNIFSFLGEEIYFDTKEEFIGKTFDELVQTLEGGSAIGILRGKKSLLNPNNQEVFKPNDQLIIIATDSGKYQLDTSPHENFSDFFKKDKYVNTGRNILTIGYNKNVPYVLADMDKYVGPKSKLTMLVPNEQNKEHLESKVSVTNFEHFEIIVGKTFKYDVLSELSVDHYDTIAIFANQDITEEHADAETLLSLLHIDSMRKNLQTRPSIILEIEESVNAEALEYLDVDDFLISNLLVSKIMTQIAYDRNLNKVIQELVGEERNEFYLKRVNAYVPLNKELPFYACIQAAQLRDHIVVGFKKYQQPVVLNPSKNLQITFDHPQDRLVVVARS